MSQAIVNAGNAGAAGDDADLLAKTGLPEWVVQTLADNGIHRLSELSPMTDRQLLKLRGIGRRSVELLRAEMKRPADKSAS